MKERHNSTTVTKDIELEYDSPHNMQSVQVDRNNTSVHDSVIIKPGRWIEMTIFPRAFWTAILASCFWLLDEEISSMTGWSSTRFLTGSYRMIQ